jgi:NAD(P)H-hydrate epimerase
MGQPILLPEPFTMNDLIPHLTAAQMREADRRCIEDIGIPGVVLMNNAGAAVFRHISGGPVGIVCGKGNNGGDGYVVARLSLLAGFDTRVVVLAEREAITGDALTFLRAYENLGGYVSFASTVEGASEAVRDLAGSAVLVDAILGTGITGEVRGVARAAIDAWPTGHCIAVDLPSGMDADTGEPCGACIRADVTVTFQFPKVGFRNPEAAHWLGELIVADIGIPKVCADVG